MEHELVIVHDAASLATRAANFVKERAGAAVADSGRFTFAVSGGKAPWAMFSSPSWHVKRSRGRRWRSSRSTSGSCPTATSTAT